MLKIIKFYWPALLVFALTFSFSVYLKIIPDTECHFIFGQSTSLLALYEISYGFTGLIFICTIYAFVFGWHGLKQGKYPPEAFPIYSRKTSYGVLAKIINITALLSPLFGAFLIYLGVQTIDAVGKGKTHQEMNQIMVNKCTST